MPPKQTDILKRPLYLFDLPPEVLNSLIPRQDDDAAIIVPASTTSETSGDDAQDTSSDAGGPVGSQACSTCRLSFANVLDQRSHLRSDLHHYNLKQKLRGQPPVTEVDFEKLIGDLDESLSGSDSSESDEDEEARKDTTLTALLKKQANLSLVTTSTSDGKEDEESLSASSKNPKTSGKPPLLWFSSPLLPTNTYFGIYRSIFTTGELSQEGDMVERIRSKQLESMPVPKPDASGRYPAAVYQSPHVFLCMIGGGHFAAMIVSLPPRQTKHGQNSGPLNREATVLHHKTFHRYTTRRKQGGSQSANDNAKGKAHSAGSNIRRANEQALITDVRALLAEWKDLIDSSENLFIRASGIGNRRILYDDYPGRVLRANDPRIKGFPFNTRRATQNELMRSFVELTRLKVQEIIPVDKTKAPEPGRSGTATPKPTKPAAPKLSEEEETALLHTSQLQAFVRRSKLPALLSYFQNNSIPADFRFQPESAAQNHHAPTALHLAASMNSATLVLGLIVKGGADPTVQNQEGKTPFLLAGDRSTRDAFRVARDEAGEDKWDWDAAGVPAAMKRADAERRDQRDRQEAEKKEAERRAAEEERLKTEGPKVAPDKPGGRIGPGLLDRSKQMTAQDRREEEARGLTLAQKTKLERERRARAAEERMKRMQQSGQ
ncbi:Bacteroidetes VLRF1 release factor [Microdochium nivale]|nr:Bacteroidetes VLRF1 release factor [Microdochium nivale]